MTDQLTYTSRIATAVSDRLMTKRLRELVGVMRPWTDFLAGSRILLYPLHDHVRPKWTHAMKMTTAMIETSLMRLGMEHDLR